MGVSWFSDASIGFEFKVREGIADFQEANTFPMAKKQAPPGQVCSEFLVQPDTMVRVMGGARSCGC